MHRTISALALALLASSLACTPTDLPAPVTDPMTSARAAIETRIADSGADVAVAFRTLDGAHELLLSPDEPFHAASTMKVPVMIELFRQRDTGALSLDDEIQVTNTFSSIIDGSSYELSADEDSDRDVYRALGSTMTLRALCEAMITESSNLATNLLIEHLGVDAIRATVERLGGEGMEVVRGVEDLKAFEAGRSNSTTARALLVLLQRLAEGALGAGRAAEATDPETFSQSAGEMVEILKRQQFRDGIPAGLPEGVEVAHKTGTITRIHHDAGIVFTEPPFVLVVLTRGLDDETESARLIADIAGALYDALSDPDE